MGGPSSRADLAEILRQFGPAYLAEQALSRPQAKAWRAIVACRTAALGGHVEQCAVCGTTRHVYHSCRNRHCPKCQTRAKEQWLAARRQELLPVPYFHLVFTLPHALNGLIAARPQAVYEMLFTSASATLLAFAANPRWLGGVPAFTLVLHTWQQDLGRHVHVHALVAGGALTPDGSWQSAKRGFLFPVKALSRVFRAKFLAALDEARQHGRLQQEPALSGIAWSRLRADLLRHDWVVYAKQPPGGPAQVLEYLGRYTHRVAISNERILGVSDGQVVFRVRAGEPGQGKKRVVRLPGTEFVRRFLLHVLPPGFKRIRHYGLLAAANKAERLALARAALDVPPPDPVVIEEVADFLRRIDRIAWRCCPACGAEQMVVIAVIPRPTFHPVERAPP
jgi:hypothetical protein